MSENRKPLSPVKPSGIGNYFYVHMSFLWKGCALYRSNFSQPWRSVTRAVKNSL